MIRAVIFDWGRVIAPTPRGGWLDILADMLDVTVEELLPHWQAADYKKFSAGLIDETTFWAQFEKSLGKSLPADKERIWTDGSALETWPEVLELVDDLHKKGILTAILSNTVKPLSAMLRDAAQYDGFDCVVLSDEVGLVKPDKAIYQLIVKKLGVKPEECIYIDDLARNLVPAADMGMVTILASDDPKKIVRDIESALWAAKCIIH